jgi:hypothetical protein
MTVALATPTGVGKRTRTRTRTTERVSAGRRPLDFSLRKGEARSNKADAIQQPDQHLLKMSSA